MKQGPSGTAKRNPTEKEQCICGNFGFLVDHITWIPGRQGTNVLSKRIAKKKLREVEDSSSAADESEIHDHSDPDISMDAPPAAQTKGGPYKKKRKEPAQQQTGMDQLVDFAKSSSGALQATMQQMVVSAPKDLTERRIQVLGDFIVAECITLDPETFDDLHAQLLPMFLQL